MKNINEYDRRQLKLMYESLISFEKNHTTLNSLIGNLEFLLNVMEHVEDDWEEKFLTEITTLETINALEIMKDAGEEIYEIKKEEREELIKKAISNLKTFVKKELMNEHQHRLWKNMIDLIESYLSNETQDFYSIVGKLEGVLDASEIKDNDLINQWYDFWMPLENRRTVEGKEVNRTKAVEELTAMKKFLIKHL